MKWINLLYHIMEQDTQSNGKASHYHVNVPVNNLSWTVLAILSPAFLLMQVPKVPGK